MSEEEYYQLDTDDQITARAKELVKERQAEEDKLAEEKAAGLNNSFGGICVRDFSKTRVLERLSLYEQRLQKQLFTAQIQLDRLQQKRKALEEKQTVTNFVTNLKDNNEPEAQ